MFIREESSFSFVSNAFTCWFGKTWSHHSSDLLVGGWIAWNRAILLRNLKFGVPYWHFQKARSVVEQSCSLGTLKCFAELNGVGGCNVTHETQIVLSAANSGEGNAPHGKSGENSNSQGPSFLIRFLKGQFNYSVWLDELQIKFDCIASNTISSYQKWIWSFGRVKCQWCFLSGFLLPMCAGKSLKQYWLLIMSVANFTMSPHRVRRVVRLWDFPLCHMVMSSEIRSFLPIRGPSVQLLKDRWTSTIRLNRKPLLSFV